MTIVRLGIYYLEQILLSMYKYCCMYVVVLKQPSSKSVLKSGLGYIEHLDDLRKDVTLFYESFDYLFHQVFNNKIPVEHLLILSRPLKSSLF